MRRLFWRAGFGATPREARHWARRGKAATIRWLLNGGPAPAPRIAAPNIGGAPLDPVNEWGHDALWWLDRMVRSPRPLQEKLTLFWHDHFATTDQDTPLMLAQNRTLRRHALGSFPSCCARSRATRRCCCYLSLANSDQEAPNENFARELMELFTLGARLHRARHPRGRPCAHRLPRGLGGRRQRAHLLRRRVPRPRASSASSATAGASTGRTCSPSCVSAPALTRRFSCGKLWEFFVGAPPPRGTRAKLAAIYRRSGRRIRPVVARDPRPPGALPAARRPGMVKSPVVFLAGALRSSGQGIERDSWGWLLSGMGQMPFRPPSVAGWEWGTAWLSTNSMRVRFDAANHLLDTPRIRVEDDTTPANLSPARALARARRAVGQPWISPRAEHDLLRVARRAAARSQARRRRMAPARAAARGHVPAGAAPAAAGRPGRAGSLMVHESPPRLRRLPPQLGGRAPRLPRRSGPHAPAGVRSGSRRGPGALRSQGDAAHARVRGGGRRRRGGARRARPRVGLPPRRRGSARHARPAARLRSIRRPPPQAEGAGRVRSRAQASASTRRWRAAAAAASRDCSSAARSASCRASTTPTRTSRTSTRAISGRPG